MYVYFYMSIYYLKSYFQHFESVLGDSSSFVYNDKKDECASTE
jgi:hypothetical protein